MSDGRSPVASLREAAATLDEVRAAVGDADADLESVAGTYRDVEAILDRYEERATDWDDFEGYIRFREDFSERLASIPDDFPHRDAFTAADDVLTTDVQRTLSTDDFDAAREHLAPVRELAALYDRWRDARETYREARREVARRRDDLRTQVSELERVRELGDADLDAPVHRLCDPIESYNDAVGDAFESFLASSSAREVFDLLEATTAYPLVPFRRPPSVLREYVADAAVGEEPVSTLLEYADYSRSKLDHYVADPQAFQSAVGTNRTYLRTLDADPLTVSWPPAPADRLRFRARELVAVVGRFAPEAVVAEARAVRAVTDRDDYARLRDSAVARAELDEAERERLRRGEVADELDDARARLRELRAVLDDHSPLDAFSHPKASS